MSFDIKNKENNDKYCLGCLSKSDVEHVCSSQILSDSASTLSEMGNEQLNMLETFSLSQVHIKCQEELDIWHQSAINHLGQIFNQRVIDLNNLFNSEIQTDLENYKQKLIQQIKDRIIPKINKLMDDPQPDAKKAQQIQV
jgi:hypothetical protein